MIGAVAKMLGCLVSWPKPVDACRGAFARARLARRTWPGLCVVLAGALLASAVPLGSARADCGPASTSYVGTSGDCLGLLVITQGAFDAAGSATRSQAPESSETDGDGSFTAVDAGGNVYGVEQWYTAHITNMRAYFYQTEIATGNVIGDIRGWDTSSVTTMNDMFIDATNFNQDIGDWDLSSVQDVSDMFRGVAAFNQDIGGWDVSEVWDFNQMFEGATAFNQDIGDWDVSSALGRNRMIGMFRDASSFNQDLSNWPVRHIGSEPDDFNAGAFDTWASNSNLQPQWGKQDTDAPSVVALSPENGTTQGNGDLELVVTFDEVVVANSGGDIEIYETSGALVERIEATSSQVTLDSRVMTIRPSSRFSDGGYYILIDTGAVEDRNEGNNFAGFTSQDQWQFDVLESCEINASNPTSFVGAVSPCDGWLVVSQADFDAAGSSKIGGDGSFLIERNGKLYDVSEWYTANIVDMDRYFYGSDVAALPSIVAWDTSNVASMYGMFKGFSSFDQPIGGWDVSKVTDMAYMFHDATDFNQSLQDWDTGKATRMSFMFDGAENFEGDIGDWDVSNVTRLTGMFGDTEKFNADIGGWDVRNVESMDYMFKNAVSFDRDLSDWNVSEVTDMEEMFRGASSFNGIISDWDVSKVNNMEYMFQDAVSFDRDLSKWNVSEVTNMQQMFRGASSFNGEIRDWDVSKVTNMASMFRDASAFNQDLSGWDVSYFEEEPSYFNWGADSTWVANDAWQPQWGFSPLTISDYEPAQNAIDIDLDATLSLTFAENVQAGDGAIRIYGQGDGSSLFSDLFAELDVTQSGVTFSGATVTIDLANNFAAGETYAVTIDQGAIVDSEQEAFVGISDTAQWQFTTTGTGVSASESSVTANASSVGLDDFAVITVTVKDASGAAVTGVADQILGSVDLDGASFFGPFTEDEQTAGLYTAGLQSTAAGAATVRIEIAGTQLDDTATVTFVAAPAAPTDLSVTPADGSLALTWVAPDDGGSAITHYEYKLTQGEEAGSYVSTNSTSPSASIAIQNGLAYSVLVRAVNAYGNGVDSQTVTLPSVTLGTDLADADVVAEPFTVTAVFSESVTGFEQEDISVTKGSLSAFAGSEGNYSFTVTPTEDGDVTIRIPASVATSGSGQLNTASVALVQAADVTGATLTLSSEAENPVTETFTVLASFSEAVTSFDPEHISLDKATLGEVTEVSSTVYSFQVTPVEDGTVTVSVAAGAAEDALGNPSTQDSLERTADVSRPVPSLKTSAPAYVNGPFSVTVEFSEAVTDFTEADLEVSNALIDKFTGAEETYNFNVTPQEDGPVTVDVPAGVAQDLAGNSNDASEQHLVLTADSTAPTLTLSTLAANPVGGDFTVNAEFSEDVTGFDVSDVAVENGNVTNFQGSGASYSFDVEPLSEGEVTLDVAAGAAQDLAGNWNAVAAATLSMTADFTGPTLKLSTEAGEAVGGLFTVTAEFSEAVTGFVLADIAVSNGTASNLADLGGANYSFDVTPSNEGTVTVAVAADAADDSAGNGNTAAAQLSRTADFTGPSLGLTSEAGAIVGASFTVTAEFSEDVTGFALADIEISNGTASSLTELGGARYSFDVTPSNEGTVTVAVAADAADDSAGNGNTAATPLQVSADLTGPTVGLTSDADPVGGVFTVTVEFSEDVTGFALGHIAVGNGVASSLSGSEADYSFEVTPSSNGTVTVDVAADVVMDSVGNGNRAATRLEVTADLQAPTVSLFTEAGDFVAGAFTVTATFSEAVTGFALNDDVVVTNASVDGFTGSGAEYSFEVTPLSDGLVTVDIGAGAAQDGVGNPTAAAAQLSRTADLIAPTVTLKTSALEPINGTFAVTAEFSEEVSNFTLEDLTLGNANADTLTGAGKVYDFNVTPTGTGTMTIAVVEDGAQDRAGNGNEASNELSLTADLERPTLELETQATSPVGAKFAVTATFTEAVTNFDSSDVQVTNGSVDNFQGSGQAYSFDITPAGNGDVRVDVAADAAQDAAGNGNEAAQTLSMVADLEGSTLGLNTEAGSPLGGLFLVTATFSEDVTGFELGDIQVDNGTADKFSGSGASYSFEVSPLSDGTVTVRVAENVAVDGANNGNAAAQLEREADLTDPTVDLSTLAAGPFAGVFSVTVEFSEDVTDFGLDDVVVSNATLGNLLGSGAVYTFNVTPLATGLVTVDVPADAAFDAAGNPNEAAAQLEREADLTVPTVSLETLAGPVVSDVFAVTATFSENVTGFEAEDVTVVNGEVSAFVATSAQAYSFDVTPLEEGPVTVDVLKDVAHDGAGNGNTAATQLEVTASLSAASVELATEAVSPVTGTFSVTATFTKTVTGFAVDDVTVGNGAAGNFTGSGSDYRFDVTPAGDGVVSVDVAAGVATDSVGDGNAAAQTLSVTADVTAPLLSLSTEATGTVIAPFMVEAGFSEDVNGFVEGDVAVTNGTVSDFTSVSASAYTFEVTPASSGDVVVTVASGAASDDAGHSNAAASLEVTADVDAPTVSLSTTAAQPVASTFSLTATFSDAVTGFSNAGIHVDNGDLETGTLVSTDDQTYQFDVTPSGGGDVRVQIVAGAAQDDAGNASTASNELSLATDEDVSGLEFVVSQSSLDLSEGSSETLTLALGLRPSGQVSLGLASSNTGVVNVSAAALIFDPDDWNAAQTVTVTAQEISGNADASASLILVATGAEFDGVSHTLAVAIDNSDGLDEDTGALAASIATSEVMGSQLGDLISDAAVGGLSRGPTLREGDLVENGLPGGNIIQFAQQPQDPNYRRLHILSARDGGQGFSLVDWFSVGLSSASVDAELQGDGSFAYAVIGSEMTKTANAVGGLLYGFEASSWDYEAETDVDRAGISVGYYGARRDRGLVYTGSTTLTLSQNDFVTASGATGTAGSYRLILKAGISGDRTIGEGGGRLTPFVDLMYASEQLEAFVFSDGSTSSQSTADLGRLGVGLEYATAPSATGNQVMVRGELSQVFGASDLTLSDGETYSPNEAPVGSVTFGWISKPGADSIARIELTFGELGNDEAEEIRLDGTVDRNF